MSGIYSCYQKYGKPISSKIVEGAMKELEYSEFNSSNFWINGSTALGCNLLHTTPESIKEISPYYDPSSECCIVADARIDYREELAIKLGLNWDDSKDIPDSHFILMSYLKWGNACVKRLLGDFSFIIWDVNKGSLFIARDHFGSRPLFYMDNHEYFAVASDPKAFQSIPGFKLQIKDQYILDAICFIIPDKSYSAFEQVDRLEPATYLEHTRTCSIYKKRYWDLRIQPEFLGLSEYEATSGIRERFIDSVNERSRTTDPIGVELSGGLDSSSVTSCLMKIVRTNSPVYAYTQSLPDDTDIVPMNFESELHYSSKVVQETAIRKHFFIKGDNSKNILLSLEEFIDVCFKPVNQTYAVMSDLLYDKASESGIGVILSGFGGDEGVTNKAGAYFEELIKSGNFKSFKKALNERIEKEGGNYHRKLIKHIINVYAPFILRIIKEDWRLQRFETFAINKDLSRRYSMKKRFLSRVKSPNDSNVRKRQYKRILHPHLSDRMENSYFLANIRRIEYRYPLLDVKLLEFYYSLPSSYKFKEGVGRYVFRKSMEGIVPSEIINRKEKAGATIPNVMYRIVDDYIGLKQLIETSRERNKFHYVDYDKLIWLLNQIIDKDKRKSIKFVPREILSPISVLILQRKQREGKIDIGIKC